MSTAPIAFSATGSIQQPVTIAAGPEPVTAPQSREVPPWTVVRLESDRVMEPAPCCARNAGLDPDFLGFY